MQGIYTVNPVVFYYLNILLTDILTTFLSSIMKSKWKWNSLIIKEILFILWQKLDVYESSFQLQRLIGRIGNC